MTSILVGPCDYVYLPWVNILLDNPTSLFGFLIFIDDVTSFDIYCMYVEKKSHFE